MPVGLHNMRAWRRRWLLGALALFCAGVAQADALDGVTGCGAYSIERRADGTFQGSVCGGTIEIAGTYDAAHVALNRVSLAALPALSGDASFALVAPDWRDTLQRLAPMLALLASTATRLQEEGVDVTNYTAFSVGPVPACNETAPGFHILQGALGESVSVGAGCVAIAPSSIDTDTLLIHGRLYGDAAVVATTARVDGGFVAAQSFTVGSLALVDARIQAATVTTNGLQASGSIVIAGDHFDGRDPRLAAGALVRFDQGSVLSAVNIEGDRIELHGGSKVAAADTFSARKLALTHAFAAAKAMSLGTLDVASGELVATALTIDGEVGLNEATVVSERLEAGQVVSRGSNISLAALATGRFDSTEDTLGASSGLEIEAGEIVLNGSLIDAGSLFLAADVQRFENSQIDAGAELRLDARLRSRFVRSLLRARHIVADLADGIFDKDSRLLALPSGPVRTRAVLMDLGENAVAPDLTGASYGGFGGTAGTLYGNLFVPAEQPFGDPRFELPIEGRGGCGIEPGGAPLDLSEGGNGGGVIALRANRLVWEGLAAANGGNAPPHGAAGTPFRRWGGGGGGGSGGSVRVMVRGALSGGGSFQANGGSGSYVTSELDYFAGGGGSGGRVRIDYGATSGWTGKAQALGGEGGRYNPGVLQPRPAALPWDYGLNHGGPGTVYWKPADGPGTIVIDGANGPGGVGYLSGDFSDDHVKVNASHVVTDGLKARSLVLTAAARLTADNPRMRLQWPPPRAYPVPEGFTATQDGHARNSYPASVATTPLDERVQIIVSEGLRIDATSRIDLSGQGGYSRRLTEPANRSGGSHGGVGGYGRQDQSDYIAAPPYDDPEQPMEVGLGGSGAVGFGDADPAKCALGGAGGGVLRLVVGRTLALAGAIAVDGADGVASSDCYIVQGSGGGAGGSLWVTAGVLTGNGVISASGGRGSTGGGAMGGGGGGGRIAVYAAQRDFHGALRAKGGPAPPDADPFRYSGSDGSVVVDFPPDADGDGVLDAFDNAATPSNGGSEGGSGAAVLVSAAFLIYLRRLNHRRKRFAPHPPGAAP